MADDFVIDPETPASQPDYSKRGNIAVVAMLLGFFGGIAYCTTIFQVFEIELASGGCCWLSSDEPDPLPTWPTESVRLGEAAWPTELSRAARWLWERQNTNGLWTSATYATLRGGSSLTPLAAVALHDVGEELVVASPERRAAMNEALRSMWSAGYLSDDPLEYPNYSIALAIVALTRENDPTDRPLIAEMATYLVGQQYNEANGFVPAHPAYGGWGFSKPRSPGGSPGHMDLGHTRHVLQALRAAGHKEPATYARAEKFLALLQKHPSERRPQPSSARVERPGTWKPPYDGGFYFSPIVHAANKGGEQKHEGQPYFASYATTTCDGVLSLLACGVPRDDERITSAIDWLKRHPRLDFPEGVLEGTDANWGVSIRFYHFAVRAECYAALDWPGEWRRELREILAKLQQADGSFVNREGFLMKEDDPIVCTALAVAALVSCADRK